MDDAALTGANPITLEVVAPSTTVDATASSAFGAKGWGIISIGGGAAKFGGGIPGGNGAPGRGMPVKLGGRPGGKGCVIREKDMYEQM